VHPVGSRFVVALVAGLTLVWPRVGWADTDRDRAAARSTAEAGADAFDAGQYERALELFGRAEQLVHAPTHLLFMARSLAKLGRLVEAHEVYLKIVKEQLPPNAPSAFKTAHKEADAEIGGIEARIAYVTVTVRGGDGTQATLRIDHTDVPAAEQGIPIPMDPGTHVFSASSGERQSPEKSVNLAEGAKQSLELTLPVPTPEPAARAETPTEASPEPANGVEADGSSGNRGTAQRIIAYTSMGLGLAGAGVGTYFLVSSVHKRDLANQAYACNAEPDGCTEAQMIAQRQYDHDADRARNWAIGSYAVGAALLGTGIVLLVTAPHADNHGASLPVRDLRIVAGPSSLIAAGRF
jgi:hypothetical protein